jgi:hypothetical protein
MTTADTRGQLGLPDPEDIPDEEPRLLDADDDIPDTEPVLPDPDDAEPRW